MPPVAPAPTHNAPETVWSYDKPLGQGILRRRYKRFLADVELEDGSVTTIHCANSGSMRACCEEGQPILMSDSQNPKRKLQHTWEMIHMGACWVGVHSALANRIVEHVVRQGAVESLASHTKIRREVRYGEDNKSRIDLLLETDTQPVYVEVKHGTMRVDDAVAFPDAVSTRATKHVEELIHVVDEGARAVMLFSVGRSDVSHFRPADEIDPNYASALRRAADAGVELYALQFDFAPEGVRLAGELPVRL